METQKSSAKINYINSRREARIIALSGLYEYFQGNNNLENNLSVLFAEKPYTVETKKFAELVATGTLNSISEIDPIIKENLSMNWDFNRLGLVEKIVLRIAMYEILHCKEIPLKSTLTEALYISDTFGSKNSAKLVHGVLGGFIKQEKIDKEKLSDDNIELNIESEDNIFAKDDNEVIDPEAVENQEESLEWILNQQN